MKIKFLFISILIANLLFAQNLIINPSFEDSVPLNNWSSHFRYCKLNQPVPLCTNLAKPTSSEYISFHAQDGNNCIAISLFFMDIKESDYIISDIQTLEKGKNYSLSFYISPDDSSGLYTKNLDVLFCSTKYLKQNISCLMPQKIFVKPTLTFDISTYKKDGNEGIWTKLNADFIATGIENVMVIGNFSDPQREKYYGKKVLSYKTTKKFRSEHFGGAEYYLDNFSLVEKL